MIVLKRFIFSLFIYFEAENLCNIVTKVSRFLKCKALCVTLLILLTV